MKLLLSALLLAALPVAFAQNPSAAQNQTPSPSHKAAQQASGPGRYVGDLTAHKAPMQMLSAACPLTLTSARLHWPAAYMPVTSAEQVTEPSLALRFQNASGKSIRSVAITAEMRVKKDPYALDATPIQLRLSFAGTKDLDKELSQLATIPLPKGLHEYGVVQVRLDRVLFADGTLWKAAAGTTSCSVASTGLIAAK